MLLTDQIFSADTDPMSLRGASGSALQLQEILSCLDLAGSHRCDLRVIIGVGDDHRGRDLVAGLLDLVDIEGDEQVAHRA